MEYLSVLMEVVFLLPTDKSEPSILHDMLEGSPLDGR